MNLSSIKNVYFLSSYFHIQDTLNFIKWFLEQQLTNQLYKKLFVSEFVLNLCNIVHLLVENTCLYSKMSYLLCHLRPENNFNLFWLLKHKPHSYVLYIKSLVLIFHTSPSGAKLIMFIKSFSRIKNQQNLLDLFHSPFISFTFFSALNSVTTHPS